MIVIAMSNSDVSPERKRRTAISTVGMRKDDLGDCFTPLAMTYRRLMETSCQMNLEIHGYNIL